MRFASTDKDICNAAHCSFCNDQVYWGVFAYGKYLLCFHCLRFPRREVLRIQNMLRVFEAANK